MSKKEDSLTVTLNETTKRWMAQWDKFEAGEISPSAIAKPLFAITATLQLLMFRNQ